MTVKHTPGPWNNDCSGNITHQDGQPIAFVNWTAYDAVQANARLIAAAPELLDAAIEFCRKVEYGEAKSLKSYAAFKSAIAKATGKPS